MLAGSGAGVGIGIWIKSGVGIRSWSGVATGAGAGTGTGTAPLTRRATRNARSWAGVSWHGRARTPSCVCEGAPNGYAACEREG